MPEQGQHAGVAAKTFGNLEECDAVAVATGKNFETNYVPVEGDHFVHVRAPDGNFTQRADFEFSISHRPGLARSGYRLNQLNYYDRTDQQSSI